MPTCSSCQKHVEATWKVCPFCEERLDSSEVFEDNIVIRDSVMMAEKIEIKSGNTSLECPQCKDEGHITLSICKTCDNKFCQSCKTRSIYCEKCSELRRKERLEQERKLEIERLRIQQERYEMQKQTDIANLLLKQQELSEKIKSLNEEYLDLQRTEENLRSDVEDCVDEMSVLRMSKQKLLDEYDVEKNRIFYGKTIEEHESDILNLHESDLFDLQDINIFKKLIKIDTTKINKTIVHYFLVIFNNFPDSDALDWNI
jgi:RNA polymerase subunit RPABC4/transcription elongation factor Spt4